MNGVWWSAYARVYDRLWDGPLTARLADTVVALAGPPEGVTADIGAGTGLISVRLAAAGHTLTCVDADPAMLDRLRRRVPDALAVVGHVGHLPLPAGGVHTVVATNVLHLCDDPAAAMHGLAALVAPGGSLICSWPGPDASIGAIARRERACAVRPATVAARFAGRWIVGLSAGFLTRVRRTPAATLEAALRRVAAQERFALQHVELPHVSQTVLVLRRPIRKDIPWQTTPHPAAAPATSSAPSGC